MSDVCTCSMESMHTLDCPAFVHHPAPKSIDPVNHPAHYETNGPACAGCGRIIQCIEVREDMTANLSDALKYLWRCGDKDGADPIQDLHKSIFYIEREIKRLKRGGA